MLAADLEACGEDALIKLLRFCQVTLQYLIYVQNYHYTFRKKAEADKAAVEAQLHEAGMRIESLVGN